MSPPRQQDAACKVPLLDPGPGVVTDQVFIISGSAGPRTIFQSDSLPALMQRSLWSLSDFDVKGQLYRSATSLVVLATDQRSRTDVVLKLYLKAKLVALTKYQVEREIRIHSRLSHPEVISLYAAFENKKYVVLVLEHCRGGDLHAQLAKVDRRPCEAAACAVVQRLASAVAYLHSQNIIHRDIKPENILLSDACGAAIKLADFGLSIDCSQERPVTRGGTLDYMAPEILLCHNKARPQDYKDRPQLVYDTKVDAWAIGVLTFELLVGRTPFEHECRYQTVERIMYQRLEFPPGVSPLAKDFVSQLLCKGAKKRSALADMLDHPWFKAHAPPRPPATPPLPGCQPGCQPASPSLPVAITTAAAGPDGALGNFDLRIIIQSTEPDRCSSNAHPTPHCRQQTSSFGSCASLPGPPHPLLASHCRSSAPDLTALPTTADPEDALNCGPLSGHTPSAVGRPHRAGHLPVHPTPLVKAGSLPTASHMSARSRAAARQGSLGSSDRSMEDLDRAVGRVGAALGAAPGAAPASVALRSQSHAWAKAGQLQRIVENTTLSVSAEAGVACALHGAPTTAGGAPRAPTVASRVSYLLSAMSFTVAPGAPGGGPAARTSPRSACARPAGKVSEQDMAHARHTWDAIAAAQLSDSGHSSSSSRPARPARSNSLNSPAAPAAATKHSTRKLQVATAAAAAVPAASASAEPMAIAAEAAVAAAAVATAAALPPPSAAARGCSAVETQRCAAPLGGVETVGPPMRMHVKLWAAEGGTREPLPKDEKQPQAAAVSAAAVGLLSRLSPSSSRELRPPASGLLRRLFCFGGPRVAEV